MKKTLFMLLVIGMMAATQQVVSAQTTTDNSFNIAFTSQIGDSVSYSAFELTEYIVKGNELSDEEAEMVLDEFEKMFPENCTADSPAIQVLKYAEGEYIFLQHNTDEDLLSICMKTDEDGWISIDPGQDGALWKVSILVAFSELLLEIEPSEQNQIPWEWESKQRNPWLLHGFCFLFDFFGYIFIIKK